MPDRDDLMVIFGNTIQTPRLRLRPWTRDDAAHALDIFGAGEVARWLAPAMAQVPDEDAMRGLIDHWTSQDVSPGRPAGRWAIEETRAGRLAGAAAILPLPPVGEDLEIGWQLAPAVWGQGYASEAGRALAHFAFSHGEEEVFAVVRPRNARGIATARRVGMEWVGETDKYYDLQLQVYRLRKGELDLSALARAERKA